MPTISESITVPAPPDRVWGAVADLGRWGEWLSVHSGWPDGTPDPVTPGMSVTEKVKVMGMPAKVSWVVEEVEVPTVLAMRGSGALGISMEMRICLEPVEEGTVVRYDSTTTGGMLDGPMGARVTASSAATAKESLARIRALF